MLHLFNIIYHTYMTDIYSVFNYTSHHREISLPKQYIEIIVKNIKILNIIKLE